MDDVPLDGALGCLGPYRLLARLGAGGMGTVYLAEHVEVGVRRAVKVLRATGDMELVLRFQREGQAMAALDHPNVARVHALGESHGQRYLVMDLIEGGDLAERLRAGRLAPAKAATLIRDLAQGLEHMHERGVLHRDIKPGNVLLAGEDTPVWVDFGLAAMSGAMSLTETGTIMGTPAYMAPEQADGDRGAIDPRTDVYGLGALLYRCLTGEPPFKGRTVHQVLRQVLGASPTPVRELNPSVPASLAAVCERAMAKKPVDRFPSAAALAKALEDSLSGVAPGQGRVGWARVGAVGLAVIGLAGGLSVVARERSPQVAQGPPPTAWTSRPPTPSLPAVAQSSPPLRAARLRLRHTSREVQIVPGEGPAGRLWSVGPAGQLVCWGRDGREAGRWDLGLRDPLGAGPPRVLLSTSAGLVIGGKAWGRLWREPDSTLEIPPVRCAVLHPSGKHVLVGSRELYLLDLESGKSDLLEESPGEGLFAVAAFYAEHRPRLVGRAVQSCQLRSADPVEPCLQAAWRSTDRG